MSHRVRPGDRKIAGEMRDRRCKDRQTRGPLERDEKSWTQRGFSGAIEFTQIA